MANNYMQFSAGIATETPEERQWLKHQLQGVFLEEDDDGGYFIKEPGGDLVTADDEEGTDVPRFLAEAVVRGEPGVDLDNDLGDQGFDFEWRSDLVYLVADESGNPDKVAILVQQFLKRFHPDRCWSMSWACTCDTVRADEFGGGALFVTAEKIEAWDSWTAIHQWRENFAR